MHACCISGFVKDQCTLMTWLTCLKAVAMGWGENVFALGFGEVHVQACGGITLLSKHAPSLMRRAERAVVAHERILKVEHYSKSKSICASGSLFQSHY
jgi:hypothetical protein